ncbi:MAG: zinc-binding dehydrogenase [Methylobacteriaceae bacterium]|nr:zinc-binding dehydrogenase [Methylobacteriaceae bacterium]
MRVRRSTVIDAPVDAVWALLRDFNGHDDWHPAVAASLIEDGLPADRIGAVRAFRLADGSHLREQLIALSDRDRSLTYCLLDSPIPLMGYVASIRLKPVTEGDRTFWTWESQFSPPAGREEELARLVALDIYEAGFSAVRRLLTKPRPTVRAAAPPPSPPPAVRRPPAATRATLISEAIVVERYGGPEELRPRRVAVPPPGDDQVRLQQTAIGVNFIDVYCRTGFFDLLQLPGTPGMEAAGVVLDVGPGVTGLRPGDRVAYACPPVGAYADLRTMDATLLVPLPADIDDEMAAAVLLKGLSAHFLLHRVHAVQRGETALIHAAAGGVGLLLCQWAGALGAIVIGTVSSEEKAEAARRCGCRHPIVTSQEDFVPGVLDITGGRGADVIYDAVGRDTLDRSLQALAVRGHLVSFGQASGPIGAWDLDRFTAKSATLSRPNYAHYTNSPDELREMAAHLFEVIRQGQLRVTIGQRFALSEAALAHQRLEARATIGSTILVPGGHP